MGIVAEENREDYAVFRKIIEPLRPIVKPATRLFFENLQLEGECLAVDYGHADLLRRNRMIRFFFPLFVPCIVILLNSTAAAAWGCRGHEIIALRAPAEKPLSPRPAQPFKCERKALPDRSLLKGMTFSVI